MSEGEVLRLRSGRLAMLAGGGAVLGAASWLVYAAEPGNSRFLPPCILYELTGIYCPGCGSTRSLHSLLHGDVLSAFTFNPLFFVALPVLAWIGFRFATSFVSADGTKSWQPTFPARYAWTLAIVLIAFFVLRNIPVYPFTWFAPHPWP